METDKLFDRWTFDGVTVTDLSLKPYISLAPIRVPHTHGRHAQKQFAKSKTNIVERLANKLMRGGTGGKVGGRVIRTMGRMQGKKYKAMKMVEYAFDKIEKQTGQNPIQQLVAAIENAAPREGTTRVQYGGVSYQVSVDVSAQRRLDMALRLLAMAAITGAFGKKKSVADALADEIMLAAKNDLSSSVVKKRDETERVARGAR